MIIWVKDPQGQNVRVKVLKHLLSMFIKVQALDDGRKFITKLDDIFAIEFDDQLIVKFEFQGCFPPREF